MENQVLFVFAGWAKTNEDGKDERKYRTGMKSSYDYEALTTTEYDTKASFFVESSCLPSNNHVSFP